jgi:EmrB/QacA subfamily drug resistance transporter
VVKTDAGSPRRWAIMGVLGAIAFMAQLDFFIVNVAFVGIGKSFPGASVAGLSWVLNAYAIVFATVLVPAGRLADLWGRKKILIIGVTVFTLASAIASVAPTLGVLVAARAVQAVGSAMIVPTSLGLLYPNFPKRQHTLVVGLWAGVAAIAASAGPPIGGVLVSVNWRLIFLINAPIGIATVIAALILLQEVREPRGKSLPDPISGIALLGAVSLVVLATVEGPAWGWGSWRTVGLFVATLMSAGVLLQRTFRASSPIIEKELFQSLPFTTATISLFLYFMGFAIFLLGSALFMQKVWHFTPLAVGVAIAPAPITSIAFAMTAGPIQKKFGRTVPVLVGTLSMSVAAGWWLFMAHDQPSYWLAMFPALVLMGFSGGLSQAPMFAAAGSLDSDRATTGSAVLNMSRQIGLAVGVALLVAVTSTSNNTAGFDVAWWVQLAAGLAAAVVVFALRPPRAPLLNPGVSQERGQ